MHPRTGGMLSGRKEADTLVSAKAESSLLEFQVKVVAVDDGAMVR
jgi:hypothetical protein